MIMLLVLSVGIGVVDNPTDRAQESRTASNRTCKLNNAT
jgi:hypothetical protein